MQILGTPYYAAPELIEGRRYGRKADIWYDYVDIIMILFYLKECRMYPR